MDAKTATPVVDALIRLVAQYGVQCSETKELAPVTALGEVFKTLSSMELEFTRSTPAKLNPVEARDGFLKHLIETLTPEQFALVAHTADKLLTLVEMPHMLNAFTLANAELAALHYEGNLESRVIVP